MITVALVMWKYFKTEDWELQRNLPQYSKDTDIPQQKSLKRINFLHLFFIVLFVQKKLS